MSKQLLQQVVDELKNALTNGREFRESQNLEAIEVTFYKNNILIAIQNELNFTSVDNVKKFPHWHLLTNKEKNNIINDNKKVGGIRREVDQIWNYLTGNANRLASRSTNTAIVNVGSNEIYVNLYKSGGRDNFQTLTNLYYNTSKKAFSLIEQRVIETLNTKAKANKKLQNELTNADKATDKKTNPNRVQYNIASGGLSLDHPDSIAFMRAQSGASRALEKLTSGRGMANPKNTIARNVLLKVEASLEKIIKSDGTSTQTLNLISKRVNQQTGQVEKEHLKDIRKVLQEAERRSWALDKGSHSSAEIIEILLANRFNRQVKTNKTTSKKSTVPKKPVYTPRAKVISEDTKKAKVKTTTVTPKKLTPNFSSKLPRATRRKEPVQNSTFSLLTLINQALPETVAKNMNLPRLKLRTGRLASSVKATDVTTTPQGFLSIGYTYMKAPYQTFEPGYRQGSVERDPRKLIDFSIREIATGLITDRFYTRRL